MAFYSYIHEGSIIGDQEMIEDGSVDYYAGILGGEPRFLIEEEKAWENKQMEQLRKAQTEFEELNKAWKEEKRRVKEERVKQLAEERRKREEQRQVKSGQVIRGDS
jgi:hypothetical protein